MPYTLNLPLSLEREDNSFVAGPGEREPVGGAQVLVFALIPDILNTPGKLQRDGDGAGLQANGISAADIGAGGFRVGAEKQHGAPVRPAEIGDLITELRRTRI